MKKDKIKELEELCKRTQADFENYRKKNEAEKVESLNLMKADFMTKITPVLDNFRRAFESASWRSADDEFAKGIKQIEKQLEDILSSEGLDRIDVTAGAKFDPMIHEAISCERNDKTEADHIIAEVESGWLFADHVIKPAKVRVSKGLKS